MTIVYMDDKGDFGHDLEGHSATSRYSRELREKGYYISLEHSSDKVDEDSVIDIVGDRLLGKVLVSSEYSAKENMWVSAFLSYDWEQFIEETLFVTEDMDYADLQNQSVIDAWTVIDPQIEHPDRVVRIKKRELILDLG